MVHTCPLPSSSEMKRDDCATLRRSLIFQMLLFVLGLLALPQLSHAQITASLYGSVADPSGAAIPAATITATERRNGSRNQNRD